MFKYRGVRYRVIPDNCYYIILFPDFYVYHTTNKMSYPTDEEIKKYINRKFKGMLETENASNTNI